MQEHAEYRPGVQKGVSAEAIHGQSCGAGRTQSRFQRAQLPVGAGVMGGPSEGGFNRRPQEQGVGPVTQGQSNNVSV